MTRHARNCTAGPVYTYHEKQKDAKASGYGTYVERLGKDSIKDFDCCCLTLQPCRNPVVTPNGYLFDKESILEYYLKKKNEITKKIKLYEKFMKEEKRLQDTKNVSEKLDGVKKFVLEESEITRVASTSYPNDSTSSASSSISNMAGSKANELPSYWVPSKTPEATEVKMEKPNEKVLCPISGAVLRMKDLTPVKFTEIKDARDKRALIVKDARYMCPITGDTLGNSVPAAVLRPSGDVVTMDCVEKIIRTDMLHPISGQKLSEKDIIPLQRGATGYSSTNNNLLTKLPKPVLQV